MKLTQKLSPKIFWFSQGVILLSGLIFLTGLYYFLNAPTQNDPSYAAKGPVTTLPKSLRIDLDQPDDNLLTFASSLVVSGNTLPNLRILISTESQDSVVESKKDGSFSTVVKLDEGINNLTVVVFDAAGESKQIERTVYYSKEKISIINFIIPTVYAADSTPSADIKTKLEELKKEIASKAAKLKQAVSQKLTNKAYAGKVENATETSATLITKSGAKIISFNQDTLFESKIKTKKKFIKLSPGDYVASLGDIDDTGVLTAKKIILMLPPTQQKNYLRGEIVSVSGSLVTLADKNLKAHAVSLKKDFKLKLKDIVILTGNFNKNEVFEAGFVYVIP